MSETASTVDMQVQTADPMAGLCVLPSPELQNMVVWERFDCGVPGMCRAVAVCAGSWDAAHTKTSLICLWNKILTGFLLMC